MCLNYAFTLHPLTEPETKSEPTFGGGEAARLKIAYALSEEKQLIFADEPTSNMDMNGVAMFGEALSRLESFLLIAHDRAFVNQVCTDLLVIKNKKLYSFEGNLDLYEESTASSTVDSTRNGIGKRRNVN